MFLGEKKAATSQGEAAKGGGNVYKMATIQRSPDFFCREYRRKVFDLFIVILEPVRISGHF
jgi:hypothetical protein